MLFSDLPEENKASKTSTASADGAFKDKTNPANEATLKKFEKDNKMFRVHLLNQMTNLLFDLFATFKSTKIIWERREVEYGANDARKK